VGALEPQFYAALLDVLGLDPAALPDQQDQDRWPELRAAFTAAFASRPRAEWLARAEGRDACLAPVLTMREAANHPHVAARGTVVEVDGVPQPAPAPRFSRTPLGPPGPAATAGEHTDEVLLAAGFSAAEVADLRAAGVVGSDSGH
jgi:alpha-methylacyl-CoA racemase